MKRPAGAPKIVDICLRYNYFEDIVSGNKLVEYRAHTNYWKKRLLIPGVSVTSIRFRKGRTSTNITKEVKSVSVVNVADHVDEVDKEDRKAVFKDLETAIRIDLAETVETSC